MNIRLMTEDDISGIMEIQTKAYLEISHESLNVLKSKLKASPKTCWVAVLNDKILGYLFSHPWDGGGPPPLHNEKIKIPLRSDRMYLHDLAVLPETRGSRGATALVNKLLSTADELNYNIISLVAVQGSSVFWSKFGFTKKSEVSKKMLKNLTSYGKDAVYMTRYK